MEKQAQEVNLPYHFLLAVLYVSSSGGDVEGNFMGEDKELERVKLRKLKEMLKREALDRKIDSLQEQKNQFLINQLK